MALALITKLHRLNLVGKCALNAPRYLGSLPKSQKKPLYKNPEAKKFRFYVVQRYFEYLKQYEQALEKRFPSAMRVYRIFMEGMKEFYRDLKEFIKIVRILNKKGNNLTNLTLPQLELYHQMPKDMLKVAPVLILSTLPFANYVIFPLAYCFPRQLLSSHFWNLQQKSQFSVAYLKERLVHNRPVFRHLQAKLDCLAEDELYQPWGLVLAKIGTGLHPNCDEILCCKRLFECAPYHLGCLSRKHVKHLLKMHGMYLGIFRRARLSDRAHLLQAMDRLIAKNGGAQSLHFDVLRRACLIRGLNPTNMKNEDMIVWLQKWIVISEACDKTSLSLLLHSPILLGYNESSNWTLIYSNKR